jgi:asparagine synthetase B (glutamine-hydrolysing)
MNGLFGAVNLDGRPVDLSLLERIAGALQQTGPSLPEYWVWGEAGFGNFGAGGIAAEAQHCSASRLAVTVDGRIDNRDELARALGCKPDAAGHGPRLADLLLKAYRRWGEALPDHLQGAYAVAVWDPAEARLLLLRDPFGERAIYWHRSADSVLFASEPAALVASGAVDGAFRLERIVAFLVGAEPDPTWTYFRFVDRLPESCLLRVTQQGATVRRHWDWGRITTGQRDRAAASEELVACLCGAIAQRLPDSDDGGETGVLLSGGVDSSSVVCLAAGLLTQRQRQLHAFTWASENGVAVDERERSSLVLRSLPNVIEHAVSADGLWPLSRWPAAYVDPNDPETNDYPDLLLATLEAAASEGVGVLMSGGSADLILGGTAPDLSLLLGGHWGTLLAAWRRTGLRRSQLGALLVRSVRRRPPGWLTPQGWKLARELGVDRPYLPWRYLLTLRGFRLGRLRFFLNASVLERWDRLSRRTGVRYLSPYYDVKLAALVLGQYDAAVDLGPSAKSLLREGMAGRLPEPILTSGPSSGRRAQSFHDAALIGQARPRIEAMLREARLAATGLVDGGKVFEEYRRLADQGLKMNRLWEILTAGSWIAACGGLDSSASGARDPMARGALQ